MDQAVGNQTHDMNCPVVLDCTIDRRTQRQIVKELTGFDFVINSLDVRAQHPTGAQAQMTDVGIAHHTFRQADTVTRFLNQGVRIFFKEFVVVRHLRERDGVALAFGAIAKAIKNNQSQRSFFNRTLPSCLVTGYRRSAGRP